MTVKLVVLLTGILAATWLQEVHGCLCVPLDAKGYACRNGFVIRADVTNETFSGQQQELITYALKVTKLFKVNNEARPLLRQGGTFTVDTNKWLDCPVILTKGENYLIVGHVHRGEIQVDGCDFVRLWSTLPQDQKTGFQQEYYKTCNATTNNRGPK